MRTTIPIRFRMLGWSVSIFASIAVIAAQQTTPAPAASAETPAQIAHATIADLAAGNFARAAERFTAQMKAGLPEAQLRTTWATLLQQAGALKQQSAERVTPNGPMQVVVVPCEFEKMWVDIQVAIDAERRIAGLRFSPGTPPVAYTPPAYAKPDAYTEQAVTVGAPPWTLPGTLTIPTGAGPFPAVVLVHGSGPNDRDATVLANKPFRDLAFGLASRGIAVLRYEKRTREHGAQMMSLSGVTVKQETVDDAVAGAVLLRSMPRIDPRRIVVLGHSQGGMLMPRIAAAAPQAAGFIVMAGNVRSLDQLLIDQTKYLAQLDGAITPPEQQAIEQMERQQTAVKGLTLGGPAVGGMPASYWLDLRGYDPAAAAKSITRPLLVLQGERDYQVTAVDYTQWQSALAGSRTATFHLYPGLNHLFISGTGPGNPAEYGTPGHVAEDVIRDIAAWVAALPPLAAAR